MAHYSVKKSTLSGEIEIPSSKSHTLRAILFGALGRGRSVVNRPLDSLDAKAMIEACRLLGAHIQEYPGRLEIEGVDGKIKHAEDVLQAGNSGLVLRFISAIASLSEYPMVITGDYSIRHLRSMESLSAGLRQLGVKVESTRGNGFAPLIIQGPLKSGRVLIDGEDSQPVSALLIAGIFGPGPVEIDVRNAGEKPWVELTLDWLKRLGVGYERRGYEYYKLSGKGGYEGFEYTVPGDWSTAAFPLAAALVTHSTLTVRNIDINDCQGDKAIVDVLKQMGAQIEIDADKQQMHIGSNGTLKGVDVDINDFIDALPILSVVACYASGKTRIRNAAVAKGKECNRISCLASELQKMGAAINEYADGLLITPGPMVGAKLNSHDDHRMAMALAVAGLGASGETTVQNVQCVRKTFPDFFEHFRKLGAQLVHVL